MSNNRIFKATREFAEALIEYQNEGRGMGVGVLQFGKSTVLVDYSGKTVASFRDMEGVLAKNDDIYLGAYYKEQKRLAHICEN